MTSTDVATFIPTPADYRNIKNGDDALELARRIAGGNVATIAETELADGFDVLPTDQKDELVHVPFVIMEWNFYEGEFGEAVALRLVTNAGRKWIVNDGSTGLRDQLKGLGASRPIVVPDGLRVSRYTYDDGKGNQRPASTYYLSTATQPRR